MLMPNQSINLSIFAAVILGMGIFAQQPVLAGAGAGIASGISSTNLVRSRRQSSESSDLDRKLQALEKLVNTAITLENERDDRIEELTNKSIAIQEEIDLLTQQVQLQRTKNNLQLQAVRKAQSVNHRSQAIVANQAQEIIDRQAEIDRLNELVSSQCHNDRTPVAPTTHFLVDGNAMRYVAQDLGKIDYKALRDKFTKGADRVNSKFYLADVGTYGQQQFITYLEKNGFEVLLFPVIDIGGGEFKTKGDDVQIAIDAVNVVLGDRVILCGGGDSDFFPVVNRLKEMDIDFTVLAYLKTTGAALKQAAGQNLVDLAIVRSECIADRN